MKKGEIATVSAYIKNSPKEAQLIMNELRELITQTVPEATERIAWNVPIYDLDGILAGFDTTKNYVSFGIDCLEAADREELEKKGHKTGSSTVQITFGQKVPKAIFKKLLKRQEKSNKSKKS